MNARFPGSYEADSRFGGFEAAPMEAWLGRASGRCRGWLRRGFGGLFRPGWAGARGPRSPWAFGEGEEWVAQGENVAERAQDAGGGGAGLDDLGGAGFVEEIFEIGAVGGDFPFQLAQQPAVALGQDGLGRSVGARFAGAGRPWFETGFEMGHGAVHALPGESDAADQGEMEEGEFGVLVETGTDEFAHADDDDGETAREFGR